jgi:hypothetical protein
MKVKCSICEHPGGAQIVADYFLTDSLRRTAKRCGVGFRALQRHIKVCVPAICLEQNEREFYEKLELESTKLTKELNLRFNAPRLDRRIPRPQLMITKKVEFTWSRRSWKKLENSLKTAENSQK